MKNIVITIKNTDFYSIYESTVQFTPEEKPTTQYKVLDKRNGKMTHPLSKVDTKSIHEMIVELAKIDKELYEIIMEDMKVNIG